MKITRIIEARAIAQSASGGLVLLIRDDTLQISDLRYRSTCSGAVDTRIPLKNLISARFSEDEKHMILLSRDRVEVIKLAERNKRILSLGNGSGTLGCYDSADFVSDEHLLTVWEFGRARVWQIATGKYTDLGDFKTGCDGATWFRRPPKGEGTWLLTLVHLAKDGADDVLRIRMASGKLIKSVKLPTVDAQEVSGSPDGRWYAIRDTPAHSAEDPSIHIYLADGNRYLNYPYGPHLHINDLGIKSMTWTPKGDILALSTFYGDLVLLDARTFTTKKILEHTDTITWGPMGITANRRGFEPLWRETASVLNERSYERIRQPASAVITRAKPSTDPEELGIAAAHSSSDGRFIATLDNRYQSTIWIWELDFAHRDPGFSYTDLLHSVLIQYRNVRMLQWHPTFPNSLMFDCGEDIVYYYDVSKHEQAPQIINLAPALRGTVMYSWVTGMGPDHVIRAATKRKYCLVYLNRDSYDETDLEAAEPQPVHMGMLAERREERSDREEGSDLDDSLHEILTGRKPLRSSGRELIDYELPGMLDDSTAGMEDTFRSKQKPAVEEVEMDPLDDSQIF